jgi:hypothetical protein
MAKGVHSVVGGQQVEEVVVVGGVHLVMNQKTKVDTLSQNM